MARQDLVEAGGKRLPKRVREEIALEYYSKNITQHLLAEKYGVSSSTVNKIVNNLGMMKKARDFLDKEMQKADIRRNIAIMRAVNAAPDAINQIIKISGQDVDKTPVQYQYVIQNAAHEILDRAGVKAVSEENGNEVVVRFADPEGIFRPGMPDLDNGTAGEESADAN